METSNSSESTQKNSQSKEETSQNQSSQLPDSQASNSGLSEKQNSRVIGAVSYIVFFLPLLIAKDDSFAIYHSNQALILLLLWIAIGVLGSIPFFGWFIAPLGAVFCLVLLVLGVSNALSGKKEPLPLVGNFTLIQSK